MITACKMRLSFQKNHASLHSAWPFARSTHEHLISLRHSACPSYLLNDQLTNVCKKLDICALGFRLLRWRHRVLNARRKHDGYWGDICQYHQEGRTIRQIAVWSCCAPLLGRLKRAGVSGNGSTSGLPWPVARYIVLLRREPDILHGRNPNSLA